MKSPSQVATYPGLFVVRSHSLTARRSYECVKISLRASDVSGGYSEVENINGYIDRGNLVDDRLANCMPLASGNYPHASVK